MKIRFDYDLPALLIQTNTIQIKRSHFLTYRGVHYAKWVNLKSFGIQNWKITC